MSSQVMCSCYNCRKNTIGIKTGMAAGWHVANWIAVLLTGFIWALPFLIIWLCSGEVRCSVCGMKALKL